LSSEVRDDGACRLFSEGMDYEIEEAR
jgi:hypothetical protein